MNAGLSTSSHQQDISRLKGRHQCAEPAGRAGSSHHPAPPELLSGPVWSHWKEGGKEGGTLVFLGGGISWLTRNFLSSRTNVTGELHHSTPQRFWPLSEETQKVSSWRATLLSGREATCTLISVLSWASAFWQKEGSVVAEGTSRLQTSLLVGLHFTVLLYLNVSF